MESRSVFTSRITMNIKWPLFESIRHLLPHYNPLVRRLVRNFQRQTHHNLFWIWITSINIYSKYLFSQWNFICQMWTWFCWQYFHWGLHINTAPKWIKKNRTTKSGAHKKRPIKRFTNENGQMTLCGDYLFRAQKFEIST